MNSALVILKRNFMRRPSNARTASASSATWRTRGSTRGAHHSRSTTQCDFQLAPRPAITRWKKRRVAAFQSKKLAAFVGICTNTAEQAYPVCERRFPNRCQSQSDRPIEVPLTQPRVGTGLIGRRVVWRAEYLLAEICNRLVEVALVHEGDAAGPVGRRLGRIERDRLAVVGDRAVEIALPEEGEAAGDICLRLFRIELDRTIVVRECPVEVALAAKREGEAAIEVGVAFAGASRIASS
jgi:hypothetical protein